MFTITSFIHNINKYIFNPLILLMFSLAMLYFVYGVVKFLSTDAGDKGNERIEARSAILWGIVGMAIMFSVYGIIGAVLDTFGIENKDLGPTAPDYITKD